MIKRFALPAACAAVLLSMLASDRVRPASAANPSTPQDVKVVGPLDPSGAVDTVAKVKGIVNVRLNPAFTHVGQLPSENVVLVGFGGASGNLPLTESRSDGSTSAFTAVPAGKSLIIMDVQWASFGGTQGDLGSITLLMAGPTQAFTIFSQFDLHNAAGTASGHASLNAGIAFGSGTSPLVRVTAGSSSQVFLYGYYVPTP